ncbi:hypothetical protein [Lachnoclostridium edouardi]|uniref:hypothetical protein n=1 Tax=Lachnoclostridium edouardi TaxID=1926283 RepID=UPI000C79C5ED|nr:hypothetical protein [Lachnoclostridium edouardi]
MSEKLDKLICRITDNSIKVVSFDIFDTLLVRPTVVPTDLFKIIGKRAGFSPITFKEMRKTAEQEARKQKPFNVDDIQLEDIYKQFSNLFSISAEKAKNIMEIELDVEEQYLYARQSIKDVFYKALDAGKEVIITSDMYLPKDFLERVLKKNGYTGYKHFYLSCEIGKAKGTGKIYQEIIADYAQKGIKASQIIHIGDNSSADVRQAKSIGLNAEHVPSAISIFKSKKEWNRLITNNHADTDNTFLIGFLANDMFDDPFFPFASYSILNGDIKNLAYLTAPFLLSATKWILEDSINNHIDKLLLAYRDGYIPEKIYNKLTEYYPKAPKLKPIYLSRKIRYFYASKKENGLFSSIFDLPADPKMSVYDFITKRLLITEDRDKIQALSIFLKHGYGSSKNEIGKSEKYLSFLSELEPLFNKYAFSKVKVIDEYCKSCIENSDKNIACFDIGYRGSVSRFLKDEIGISNIGYHFLATPLLNTSSNKEYNLKSYVQYGFNIPTETKILHALLEDVISLHEGSAIDILKNKNGFSIIKDDSDENPSILSVQDQIIKYCEKFIALFNKDIPQLHFDHYLHFELLVHFLKSPCEKDGKAMLNLQFKDSGFITQNKDLYERWYLSHFKVPKTSTAAITVTKSNFRSSVYNCLDKMHLLPYAKKVYFSLRNFSNKLEIKKHDILPYIAQIDDNLEILRNSDLLNDHNNIVIVGDMVSFDKGICNYLNGLATILWEHGYNMVLLSEATYASLETTQRKIKFYSVIVPELLGKNKYAPEKNVILPTEIQKYVSSNSALCWAKDNWTQRHKDMTETYAQMLCYCSDKYYSQVFELIKPVGIIMWNQFHALHHIINEIAKSKNIPTIYMEFGSLPGTLALENLGQMGESYPSIHYDTFIKEPVSDYDLHRADIIWDYLQSSKLNRNVQKSSEKAENILQKIDKSRPTIFVAGQNDFESGLCPYTSHTQKYHSPIFKSSDEAVVYLAELAKKNNWNLLYKPHPIMNMLGCTTASLPQNVTVITDIDINEIIDFSDLTITILSQTGYISTIRKKPTLMLGYTQLRGKNCTYEAFIKEDIESQIKQALVLGFTEKQELAFKTHIAQMVKYYLFDDLLSRELHYGKSIDMAAEYIEHVFKTKHTT